MTSEWQIANDSRKEHLNMGLQGKRAIITGAAAGIGRAVASRFAADGATVAIVDMDSRGGEESVTAIRAEGGGAEFFSADVAEAAGFQKAISESVGFLGGLDIMFNNVGIPQPNTCLVDIEESFWDRIVAVNLRSVFLGCKYAIPELRLGKRGSIINMASIAGVIPSAGIIGYAATKAGVISLTKGLAMELAVEGIRVNCLSPGNTDTQILREYAAGNEEVLDVLKRAAPMNRLGKVEEIAAAAAYLASDEASFTTGHNLVIDGATTAGFVYK